MALLDRVLEHAKPVPADAAWFEDNYPQHRNTVHGLLLWMCDGNQHRAEEVEHLVAIKAWLHGRLAVKSDPLGWLRNQARNTLNDYNTSEKRRPVAMAPETIELEHDQVYEAETGLDDPFERFGHLLTDQELRVAKLLFVRGLKQEEAGAALGITQQGVGKALASIKSKVSESDEGSCILARSTRPIVRGARKLSDDESKNYVNLRRGEAEPADLRDEWTGPDFPVVVSRKL